MSDNPRRWLPALVVVLAAAAMAVAARHDGSLDPGVGHGLWEGARPLVALVAVVLLAAVATNFAKRRDDGYGVLHRAGTATAILLVAAAVLTPVMLLFVGRKPQPPAPSQPLPTGSLLFTPPTGRRTPPVTIHTGKAFADYVVFGVLAVLVAAAFALVVYLFLRMLSRRWFNRHPLPLLDFDPLATELDELAEAVAAGTEALEYEGDAREAVIACYAAMEQAVSAGGAGRRATDTPEEFLRRATSSQLIPEGPARRLTELFREARFSRHPIAEGQRDAARDALRAIADHLTARAEVLAAANAEARAKAEARAQAGAAAGPSATGRSR